MIHGPAAHRQQAAQPRHRRQDAHRSGRGARRRKRRSGGGGRLIAAAPALAAPEAFAETPVELIDVAALPDGGELRLLRRGDDFSIRFEGEELMGNQVRHSEQALATLVCERLRGPAPAILIGGLGMGFTLGAARAALPDEARIVVAELVPAVVAWANGPLAHIFDGSLADPRVAIELCDVHDAIVRGVARFDAILLDVDNGPDGLIHVANERLYCNWGLRAAYAALKPAGVLAVWSAYPDPAFVLRLEAAGFAVEEIAIDASSPDEGTVIHTIWLAARPD